MTLLEQDFRMAEADQVRRRMERFSTIRRRSMNSPITTRTRAGRCGAPRAGTAGPRPKLGREESAPGGGAAAYWR